MYLIIYAFFDGSYFTKQEDKLRSIEHEEHSKWNKRLLLIPYGVQLTSFVIYYVVGCSKFS